VKTNFTYSDPTSGLRPIVNFRIVGLPVGKTLLGLVDSGSNYTYIDARFAEHLEVDLESSSRSVSYLGGSRHDVFESKVDLVIGQHRWESRVRFATGWNEWHQVLGIRDLFELFRVDVDGLARITEVSPRKNDPRITRVKC
jgi:hypothetical protein